MPTIRPRLSITTLRRLLIALTMLLIIAGPTLTRAAETGLKNLRELSDNARVSALVVRLRDMKTIAEVNPDQRLRPASVSKLFAAAAAVKQFGPAHRFKTRFTTQGQIHHSTLDGNLSLIGGGDPAFDNRHLREMVATLRDRGVRRINGNVIVDESHWGVVACETDDRCKARTQAKHSYSAPLSSAGINFGTVMATVYPTGEVDQPAQVALHPHNLIGYEVDNQIKTAAPGGQANVIVWRTLESDHSTLHLRGSLPRDHGPVSVQRAAASAADETTRVLSSMLSEAGIKVTGRFGTRHDHQGSQGWTLARSESATLGELLIPMMRYSNNYMADALTLNVAAARGHDRPISLPSAARLLSRLSADANHQAYPDASPTHARFNSGSGLTLGNRIAARDLVSLLSYMFHDTALFPAFYGSLPVPESASASTLKHGNAEFTTRLTAKTGTMSEPVTVRSLAGYMRLKDGSFAAYGIVINGTRDNPELTFDQTVTAYQHDLEAVLGSY